MIDKITTETTELNFTADTMLISSNWAIFTCETKC